MGYRILSNNMLVKELLKADEDYQMDFIEGSVQEVISKCEELFVQGECFLAADPMAGRKARPFPYLTLILENGHGPSTDDWNRIADYSVLNSRRCEEYNEISERLNRDFKVLDCSFTKAALKLQYP